MTPSDPKTLLFTSAAQPITPLQYQCSPRAYVNGVGLWGSMGCGGIFRGFGAPRENWEVESQFDAADAVGWGKPLPEDRGRGIVMGMKMGPTTAASYSIVRLHPDCSVTVLSGTSDMGQGVCRRWSRGRGDRGQDSQTSTHTGTYLVSPEQN